MILKIKFLEFCFRCSPYLTLKVLYFKHRRQIPDFQNPKTLSEIILSQILSKDILNYSKYADKVAVRDYLEDLGLGIYLPKLYGVWSDVDQINFDDLPNSYALKTNHGCGSHCLCRDKQHFDVANAKLLISKVLKSKYSILEPHYRLIKPLCYAEEYISDDRGGGQPLDYKFMCSNGQIKCVLICSERDNGTKLSVYDLNWIELDWIRPFKKSALKFSKPNDFETMKLIALKIAKNFKQVRVDLYSLEDGRIFIGELTFTPEGGVMSYFTNEANIKLGI